MSIRRRCGSSSTTSILPIVWPLSEGLVRGVCRYLNGKAYPLRFVDSQYDIAAVRARDVARDRETESVAALLGGKQRLENARHNFSGDRSSRIDYVDSDGPISVHLSVELHQINSMTCIDCVQHQVQERLMHLSCIELPLKIAVDRHIDRYAFIGCVRARDRRDIVQRVGEVCPRDLHGTRTRVNQEVGGEPLESHGFFRRYREHFFAF